MSFIIVCFFANFFTKPEILAKVDNIWITKELINENETLDKVIEDLLIYKYCVEKGYLDSVKKESDYYKFTVVLGTSYKKFVEEKAVVTEGEIASFYRNYDRELIVSMVDCSTFMDAMRALREIKKGIDWGKVVNKYSKDVGLMRRSGKAGPLRWRYFIDPITKKAFSMKKGEISLPFKVNNRWYIIRLDEIKERDIRPLSEEKRNVEYQIKNEKLQYFSRKHIEYLKNVLSIKFDEKNLNEFFNIIPKGKVREPYIFPEEFYGRILARTRIGNVTYKDLQEFTVTDGRPPLVNTVDDIKNYISWKMIQRMLYVEGLKIGNHRVKGNTEKILKNDIILVTTYLKKVEWDKIEISEDTLREFYKQNQDKFLEPERRKVSIIQMKDLKELEKVRKMALSKKHKFSELAKKYSEHFSKDKGGDLGYILKETYPDIGRFVFGISKGEISDCFQKFDGTWAIIKVEDIMPQKVPEFEKVKSLVEIEYRAVFYERLRKEIADSMKERTKIKIFKKEEV